MELAQQLQARMSGGSNGSSSDGKGDGKPQSFGEAWNAVLPEVAAVSAAFCMYTVVGSFVDGVSEVSRSSGAGADANGCLLAAIVAGLKRADAPLVALLCPNS